jgi:hypothetical protein
MEPGATSATGVAPVIAVKRFDAAKTRLSPTFTIAVARIMLHGTIDHIQTSWVKRGVERTQVVLRGGLGEQGGQVHGGTDRDRRGHRPTGPPTHHHLRTAPPGRAENGRNHPKKREG